MTPNNPNETVERQEVDRLQAELATRSSILHFAHAAVAMTASLIFAGAAGKLCWDLPTQHLLLCVPPAALAFALAVYSTFRYARGKRALAGELTNFEALVALRSSLKLDDPAALLPR